MYSGKHMDRSECGSWSWNRSKWVNTRCRRLVNAPAATSLNNARDSFILFVISSSPNTRSYLCRAKHGLVSKSMRTALRQPYSARFTKKSVRSRSAKQCIHFLLSFLAPPTRMTLPLRETLVKWVEGDGTAAVDSCCIPHIYSQQCRMFFACSAGYLLQ